MLGKYLVISKKQASVLQINFGESKIYLINKEKRLDKNNSNILRQMSDILAS